MALFPSRKGAAAAAHGNQHLESGPSSEKNRDVKAHDTEVVAPTGEAISQNYQLGVKRVEAAASVWSTWHLASAYAIIWLIYFVTSIQETVTRTMSPFVTSSFELHGLTPTVSVVSSIVGGVSKLPLAKILDTWGRPQGMSLSLCFWVLGFIMMAACKNVETYAAAQVFSTVGSQAWGQKRAVAAGLVPDVSHKAITLQSVKRYLLEIDLVGIILLAAGMALFLLPFNIYSYQSQGWRSPMIICMIVFGALLVAIFVLYEKFLAPVTFIPVRLLSDRTVFFAGVMLLLVFFNSGVWGSYFYSMLMVVWNQSVTTSTYISNIYRVGSCFAALVIGLFIRWSGRFRWVAMFYGLPLMILGVGLMIKFRQSYSDIGYVIMTQIFVAFAGGPLTVSGEIAMMAPSDHQHVAVIMAILDLFGSVGSALGSTVSAAIWTSVFPAALRKYLPATAPIETIYDSLVTQLSYPVGSPIRNGIMHAYGDAQRYMLITTVSLLGGALFCTFMWRDIKVKEIKQVVGNVV
ncbi:hypothetical protein DL546_007272 [Coniochaeta pulveracea]|uniref:Major facilitator superfamily (MFS) profile domain-containing protein n=1 Tax=Coniochaeta pulveracea TaxID=177199 RepID=A0A420Y814_9PEZI|nr:hypothetical protein DL546_007272 [Coniochaeta pulveracea]